MDVPQSVLAVPFRGPGLGATQGGQAGGADGPAGAEPRAMDGFTIFESVNHQYSGDIHIYIIYVYILIDILIYIYIKDD